MIIVDVVNADNDRQKYAMCKSDYAQTIAGYHTFRLLIIIVDFFYVK